MYVGLPQTNPDRPVSSEDELSCRGCRSWVKRADVVAGVCPECGTHFPAYNKRLRGAIFDGHLHAQAEAARRNG